eukprot:1158149-Pelagomonas_calceolata.AAC.2
MPVKPNEHVETGALSDPGPSVPKIWVSVPLQTSWSTDQSAWRTQAWKSMRLRPLGHAAGS